MVAFEGSLAKREEILDLVTEGWILRLEAGNWILYGPTWPKRGCGVRRPDGRSVRWLRRAGRVNADFRAWNGEFE